MIQTIPISNFPELQNTKFENLYYIGNIDLLKRKKIAIVGTRRPSSYTKNITYDLAKKLAEHDIIVMSGTAMGVDIMAHRGAGAENTIAVVAHGVDIRYPKINSKDIEKIEQQGLVISTYPPEFKARAYTFVQRNEIIAAFCDGIIISEADLKSGSLHTANFAIKHKKPIFVIPQRLNESFGTWELVKNKQAKIIEDIQQFTEKVSGIKKEIKEIKKDKILEYCAKNPKYDEAVSKYGDNIFEYELSGKIIIKNGIIYIA